MTSPLTARDVAAQPAKARRSAPAIVQRGFAAIAAVFLVVVLAALGAFMLTFSNTQQLTSAQDLLGSRAYWAARAGLEWAIFLAKTNAACPASPSAFSVNTGAVFNLSVTCSLQSYNEGANTIKVFSLKSVATQGSVGSAGYVERSLSAALEN